MPLDSIGTGI